VSDTISFKKWKSPALFLSPATNAHGDGRLNPRVINTIWNEFCELARGRGLSFFLKFSPGLGKGVLDQSSVGT